MKKTLCGCGVVALLMLAGCDSNPDGPAIPSDAAAKAASAPASPDTPQTIKKGGRNMSSPEPAKAD